MVNMPLLFGNFRRYVILVVCLIEMIFMSGVQYGWNGLIPVWKKMGVFGDHYYDNATTSYTPAPSVAPINSTAGPTVIVPKSKDPGDRQTIMLSIAFIVSSSSQFLLTLPCGLIFDRLKLRISKMCNAVVFLLACILMGFVSAERSFLLFIAGVLFSLAAPFILIINFQIGAFFPKWQNLIVSLYSGAFDSSSVVFQLMAFGYNAGISVLASFFILGWTAAVVMTFIAFFLFPRFNMTDAITTTVPAETEAAQPEEGMQMMENNEPPPPERASTFKSVFCTRQYLFQLIWFSIIFLRFQFFLSAMPMHLSFRFPEGGSVINRLFMVLGLFLFCGIFFAPIAGIITDFLKKKFVSTDQSPQDQRRNTLRAIGVGEAICSFSGLLLTVLIYVDGESIFYFLFLLEVFMRAFLFSLNGAFSVAYYPGHLFGTLFGVMFLIGGVFSCIQFGLLKLDIFLSNAVILVLTLISFLQPVNLIVSPSACCRN